jgi:hypothetical protein
MEDTCTALPPPPPPLPDLDGTSDQLEEIATALVSMGQEVQENAFHASPNPFLDHRKVLDLSTGEEDTFVEDDNIAGGYNGDDGDDVIIANGGSSCTSIPSGCDQKDISDDGEQWVAQVNTFDTVPTFSSSHDEEEGESSPQGSAVPPHPAAEDFSKTAPPPPEGATSLATKVCNSIKYIYSILLLVFCVTLVMAAIFSGQTMGIPPIATFVVFWILIVWLGMLEGGQGCLVGLKPIDRNRYADSHPISFKVTTLAHGGDNMQRFIVGRQFVVVLIVFVTNLCGSSAGGVQILGLPQIVNDIFVASGLALMLTTVVLGQLTAQVNAAVCQLDFVNTYFMLFSTYVSLGIEWSGILHSVYLVQRLFARMAGKSIESNEPPPALGQKVFFWTRVVVSLFLLGLAFAVTLGALFQGKTTAWENLSPYASVIVFFVLMGVVGALEGAQIALFALVNWEKDELENFSMANRICRLAFNGRNLQAFLIGRQVLVTVCTFLIAKIISLNVVPGEGNNIFSVSDGIQLFFNTGLLGAIITTIFSSLIWRVVASDFPILFLNNIGALVILRLCLLIEICGICASAWICARLHNILAKYQPDSKYLQTMSSCDSCAF